MGLKSKIDKKLRPVALRTHRQTDRQKIDTPNREKRQKTHVTSTGRNELKRRWTIFPLDYHGLRPGSLKTIDNEKHGKYIERKSGVRNLKKENWDIRLLIR